jgi:hypothetical protein
VLSGLRATVAADASLLRVSRPHTLNTMEPGAAKTATCLSDSHVSCSAVYWALAVAAHSVYYYKSVTHPCDASDTFLMYL